MDRYILILTDTFEEVEALTQVDYLRRADIKVDMISITGKLQVTSNRGITVLADDLIENINLKEYGQHVPTGGCANRTHRQDKLRDRVDDAIIKKFDEEHKLISAICAGPSVLAKADVLSGRNAVIYPGMEDELLDANVKEDAICVDDNIITARGAGLAGELAYTLIRKIKGKVQEKQVRFMSVDYLLRDFILKEEKNGK